MKIPRDVSGTHLANVLCRRWQYAGFTQLYPSFSTGTLARIYVLNDRFVDPRNRQSGIGKALLGAAADYGRRVGARRLILSTEVTNRIAQALYQRLGWTRNIDFCTYQIAI